MEKRGVSHRLRKRIEEIYHETINTVRVNGEKSNKFWTNKGVRQGCPLSPTLFNLYTADLEETMKKGQDGGTVIGGTKIWTLSYADDMVLLARRPEELKEMINRYNRYLKKKELNLNVDKSKVMVFKKGRGKKKKEEWNWNGEPLEQVKEFKYLGFTFQSNGSYEKHINETAKKARIVMGQVWGLGQRKFRNTYDRRTKLFKSLVESILLYAAEIWGWKEQEKVERIQEKYIRWTLGLDHNTPAYILREETKTTKIRTEALKRALRYEERTKQQRRNEIINECWKEIHTKEERSKARWEKERQICYQKQGGRSRGTETEREEGVHEIEKIIAEDKKEQEKERKEKIAESRYCPRYKELRTENLPQYLKKDYKGRDQKTIARFRCGNEEKGARYWKKEEENTCTRCGDKKETLEHMLRECKENLKDSRDLKEILKDTGEGADWMRKVLDDKKIEKEASGGSKREENQHETIRPART